MVNFHHNQGAKKDVVNLCCCTRVFVCLGVQLVFKIMDLVDAFSKLTQQFARLVSIRRVVIVLRPVTQGSMRMMKQ